MNNMSPENWLMLSAEHSAMFVRYKKYTKLRTKDPEPVPNPITDFRQALVLLYSLPSDNTHRCLKPNVRLSLGVRVAVISIRVFVGGNNESMLLREVVFPVSPLVLWKLQQAEVLSYAQYTRNLDESTLELNKKAAACILVEIEAYKKELEEASPL
jgi:hypothetical protein